MQFPKPSAEYSSLQALNNAWDIIYGPVQSRRLGRSLGINLLGANEKVCSFNCPYCDLGSTSIRMNDLKKSGYFKSVEELAKEIRVGFQKYSEFDSIAVVGNGEPTIYPDFDAICEEIVKARNELHPNKKIAVMTNGAHLDSKKVQKGLNLLDLKMIKLDAGNDKTLRKINSPLVKENVSGLIQNARKIKDPIIQSMFVKGRVDNTNNEDIDEWIEAVGMIKPIEVHIYTITRIPAESGLLPTDEDTLYTIQAKLDKRLRIKAKVF